MTKPHDIFAIRRQISKLGAHVEGEVEPPAVLTWRPQGFARFESLWSIVHKITYLNQASATSLFRVIGKGPRLNKPWATIGLSSLKDFDVPRLASLLGISVRAIKFSVTDAYSLPTSGDVANALSYGLRFCPVCIGRGFHSPIYQYMQLARCPIHREELINLCPNCNFPILYTLSSRELRDPYRCPCGHILWPNRDQIQWTPGIAPEGEQILLDYFRWTKQLANDEALLMRNQAFVHDRGSAKWTVAAYWSEFRPIPGWPSGCLRRDRQELRGEAVCGVRGVPDIERAALKRKSRLVPAPFFSGGTSHYECPPDPRRANALARQVQPALVATFKSIRRRLRRLLREHESCIRVSNGAGCVFRQDSCPWANSLMLWQMIWSASLWQLRYRTGSYGNHWINRTLDEITLRTRAMARNTGPALQLFEWVVQRLIAQAMLSSFAEIVEREVFPDENRDRSDRDFPEPDGEHRPYFLWVPERVRCATTIYWWSRPILPDLHLVSRSDSTHRRDFRKFGNMRLRVLRDYIDQLRN